MSDQSELERAMAVKIGSAHSEIVDLKRRIANLEQDLEDRSNLIRCLEDALHLKQSNIEKAIHLLDPANTKKTVPDCNQPKVVSPSGSNS